VVNDIQKKNFIQTIKPKISKRSLFFVAAFFWTFAGGSLLYRGFSLLLTVEEYIWLRIILSTIGGILFYRFLFSKISLKHSVRILTLKIEKPCFFSFLNIRSYIIMMMMITSGIVLRKSGIIPPQYLSILYITMGIPLLVSSIRFYYYGIFYPSLIATYNL